MTSRSHARNNPPQPGSGEVGWMVGQPRQRSSNLLGTGAHGSRGVTSNMNQGYYGLHPVDHPNIVRVISRLLK